jgi:hypothetical protein
MVDRKGQPYYTRPMRRIAPCIVGLTLAVNHGGSGAGHAARQLGNFMSHFRRELGKILSRRLNLQEGW